MDFDTAFLALVGNEGTWSTDPHDRGNWTTGVVGKGLFKGTKYGISAMAYPGEDIANLSLDRAKELYKRDYWGRAGCDAVPDAVKFDLFDTAVNSGVTTAIRMLQAGCGELQDGILGPKTLQALNTLDQQTARMKFAAGRLLLWTDLPGWDENGRGWVRREANNLLKA